MATRTFTSEVWRKIGQPDLGSKMFYIDGKTGKKVWGHVTEVDFKSNGIKLKIKKF